jgi:hypothetical protein
MATINDINFEDIASAFFGGPNALARSDFLGESLRGRALGEVGRGACNKLQWVRDNTNFEAIPVMRLRPGGLTFSIEIYRKSDQVLLRTLGPKMVTQRDAESSDINNAIRKFLADTITRLAVYVDQNLKS